CYREKQHSPSIATAFSCLLPTPRTPLPTIAPLDNRTYTMPSISSTSAPSALHQLQQNGESVSASQRDYSRTSLTNVILGVRQDASLTPETLRHRANSASSNPPRTSADRAATLADHLDRVSSPTYGSARMGSARSFDGSRLGLESDRLGARLRAGVYNESGSLHQGLAEADRVIDGDTPRKRSGEHDSSTSLPVPSSSKLKKKPGLKLAIPLSSPLEERKKKYQQEGLLVASGSFGLVIRDPNDSSVLIKDMGKALDAAKMESSYFNKFYGATSSEVYCDDGGNVFLRMTKIPGTPVADLAQNDIPKNAMELYLKMISDLGDLHLHHRDLHLSNVIYDADNERFWPIDFEDVVDYGDGEHLQFQAKDIVKFEELIKKFAMLLPQINQE
ncbi:hypothetical protein ACPUER_36130, partial [Burkholderia sp. DN3021]